MCGVMPEALASRKGVPSDRRSEVSGTAKLCTNEQKLYMRHNEWDECAHQHEVQNDCNSLCRCSSDTAKAIHLTGGGLQSLSKPKEKSAEVIVVNSNEPSLNGGGLTR